MLSVILMLDSGRHQMHKRIVMPCMPSAGMIIWDKHFRFDVGSVEFEISRPHQVICRIERSRFDPQPLIDLGWKMGEFMLDVVPDKESAIDEAPAADPAPIGMMI